MIFWTAQPSSHVRTFRRHEKALAQADWVAGKIATSPVATKAEFAALVGLQRSTLTMMLKRGAIGGAALVGKGQHARINLEIAKDQLTQKIKTRIASRGQQS